MLDFAQYSDLRTERLQLRPLVQTDPDALADGLGDYDVTRWLVPVPHPYSAEDARTFQADCARHSWPVWSIFDDQGLVGGADIVASLGYWIAPRAQGNGYATEAARAVLAAYFADPDAGDVTSVVFDGNAASAAVLRKLGYVPDGACRMPCAAQGRDVDAQRMRLTRAAWAAALPRA